MLLLSSSFNDNDFQVVSGALLILSVLVPNLPSFVQRGRELMAAASGARPRRARSAARPQPRRAVWGGACDLL